MKSAAQSERLAFRKTYDFRGSERYVATTPHYTPLWGELRKAFVLFIEVYKGPHSRIPSTVSSQTETVKTEQEVVYSKFVPSSISTSLAPLGDHHVPHLICLWQVGHGAEGG